MYSTPAFHRARRDELAKQWDDLGFAIRNMNGHVRFTYSDGKWNEGMFVPAPYQLMHINAAVLHYGVSCFEGLKAFACKDGKIRLVNPTLNAERMQKGAKKLLMPEVPTELFVNGVKEAILRNREFIPPYGHGASMYVRPLLFSSGPMLGLAPLAQEYTFFVTVLPAGGYFGKGVEKGIKAVVCDDHDRAAPRGLGGVKAAGNYAADLEPVHLVAHRNGFNTTLYLDAVEHKYIEEFSVCNFVGITRDGRYVTPKSDAILESTTNKMLMQLARDRGMIVERRSIDFEKEIGEFKEVGMVGTAAVVVKVSSITRGDKVYEIEDGFETIASLRNEFTSIQCGEIEDKHGWLTEVCDAVTETSVQERPVQSSFCPGMITAESHGIVQRMSPEAMAGLERSLLEYVVQHAVPGDAASCLKAMDDFWNTTFQKQGADQWNVRGERIEDMVKAKVAEKQGTSEPVRCLELGTYCGYSALRIARNLPEGSTLLSVEKDELFAAIATKIIEFAGLEDKVKIWMGTVHSELMSIRERLDDKVADFILCDHSKERYVPDLKLLEEYGVVGQKTAVIGDTEVYPGDEMLPRPLQQEIQDYFSNREFVIATMV